jgi:nucleoside-diphosphate-sugar epimerase
MAKILITGAAGFIGYNLWEKLCIDHNVIGIDNLTDFSNQSNEIDALEQLVPPTVQLENNLDITTAKGTFFAIDILDRAKLAIAIQTNTISI